MRKIMLLFLVMLVVFIVGCKEDSKLLEDTPYIGGAKGVSINFEPGAPISEFGQDDIIDVRIKLINKGEYEISGNSAKVKLYGVSPQEFSSLDFSYKLVDNKLFPAEKGISDIGGESTIDMGKIDYSGTVGGEFVERDLLAKICYPYKTVANIEACITSKRTEELGSENICSYSGEKIKDGLVSSAPVQITSFKEELRGVSQVAFKIEFQDNGAGTVYSKDAECEDFELSTGRVQNKDRIYVELSPNNIKCSFSGGQSYAGYITLEPGQGKILTCTMDVEQEAKYTQGVGINVEYNYVETTSTKIKVLRNQ